MARLKARDFLRRKRRDRLCFGDGLLDELATTLASLETAVSANDYQPALRDCIDRLSASDQQLLALSYCGNCTLAEIARQENRSPQSVCNSLRRIRGTLLDCIEQSLDEDHR